MSTLDKDTAITSLRNATNGTDGKTVDGVLESLKNTYGIDLDSEHILTAKDKRTLSLGKYGGTPAITANKVSLSPTTENYFTAIRNAHIDVANESKAPTYSFDVNNPPRGTRLVDIMKAIKITSGKNEGGYDLDVITDPTMKYRVRNLIELTAKATQKRTDATLASTKTATGIHKDKISGLNAAIGNINDAIKNLVNSVEGGEDDLSISARGMLAKLRAKRDKYNAKLSILVGVK